MRRPAAGLQHNAAAASVALAPASWRGLHRDTLSRHGKTHRDRGTNCGHRSLANGKRHMACTRAETSPQPSILPAAKVAMTAAMTAAAATGAGARRARLGALAAAAAGAARGAAAPQDPSAARRRRRRRHHAFHRNRRAAAAAASARKVHLDLALRRRLAHRRREQLPAQRARRAAAQRQALQVVVGKHAAAL
ncbi:MAG: hypothetical protein J3K34DRAFT_418481 [Monoraphidium minutum]|nr:MAG: hypothetical protein J3K34DRAFT_418481 [Monoraphidium minutum]